MAVYWPSMTMIPVAAVPEAASEPPVVEFVIVPSAPVDIVTVPDDVLTPLSRGVSVKGTGYVHVVAAVVVKADTPMTYCLYCVPSATADREIEPVLEMTDGLLVMAAVPLEPVTDAVVAMARTLLQLNEPSLVTFATLEPADVCHVCRFVAAKL